MTARDDGLTLGDGELEATFVPGAGMVGASLRHRGDELLGQRGGLGAYREQFKTFGVPLLYPWANRLSRRRFDVAGRKVAIDPARTPLRLDESGLPIHGLLAAATGWTVDRHVPRGAPAVICATFDWSAHEALMAAFPFAHALRFEAALEGDTLTIVTTVEASAGSPVPIAFGYHPYLQLPGVDRADWQVELPVRERLLLDERTLPTGAREPVEPFRGALGDAHLRRRLRGPAARRALRARGRRAPHRAGLRRGLRLRAGLCPRRRRRDRLRADGRAHRRARRGTARAAGARARRELRGGVLDHGRRRPGLSP